MKPGMMTEAIDNAQQTAEQFAKNSKSKINKIVSADQGQFSIENRDDNTPWIKRVRVVTTASLTRNAKRKAKTVISQPTPTTART